MAQSKPRKTTVSVVYNGQARDVEFKANQKVRILFANALEAFEIPKAAAEGLGLFTAAGAQLPLDVKAADAGIKDGDQLILRPVRVGGGS